MKKYRENIARRIFETRIRIEHQLKLSKIVATTLTSRDNAGSAGVAAVEPILLPGDIFLHTRFSPVFLRMNSDGSIPSATRAHKEEGIEQNANEADRKVHEVRYKLSTYKNPRAPCSRKTTRTPHACTKYIERTERKSTVVFYVEIGNKGESFAHYTSFSCFVSGGVLLPGKKKNLRFENEANRKNARRHPNCRQLCLLACVVTLWSARTCFPALCRTDCALLCCVCGRCSTTTCSYI